MRASGSPSWWFRGSGTAFLPNSCHVHEIFMMCLQCKVLIVSIVVVTTSVPLYKKTVCKLLFGGKM